MSIRERQSVPSGDGLMSGLFGSPAMLINESQIRALIRLLADEDEKIVRTISGKLIDIGPSAVPLLQEAEIEQPEMADRLVSVLEEIRGGNLEEELMQLAVLPDSPMDLEHGAFLIARYRSEERRVGKECRSRMATENEKR